MKKRYYGIAALGIVLCLLGLFLLFWKGASIALPYVCIGVGCGLAGHGAGSLIAEHRLQKRPERRRQMEIEERDERTCQITNRAKAKAYDVMVLVFGGLMLAFSLLDVGLAPVLLFVFAYLFVQGYAMYYRCKYEKEM